MRRMVVWGLILAGAAIAAIIASQLAGPVPSVIPQGAKIYAGEQLFTPEQFNAFRKFAGSRDVELQQLAVDNFTVKFEVLVTDGVACPYGEVKDTTPANIKAVAVGVGVFAIVVLAGVWVVNIPRIGGAKWGRH